MTVSVADARAVLAANDRGGYTVPTAKLYPFQWNWDSAFVAMGFATFDLDRALTELERLVQGQWADGMIPHIVFHAPADTYFPGPEVWGTHHAPPTSGITQPPVLAIALADLARRGADPARVRALYRAALANHRWWWQARDPEHRGFVALLHPWESGRDNAPSWEGPLARVPETTTTEVRRRDTGHVDASMRPSDSEYRRFIHLVDTYRAAGWDPVRLWQAAPFKVGDVGVTAILLGAEAALLGLAATHGTDADQAEIAARIAAGEAGLRRLWCDAIGQYASHDLIGEALLPAPCSAGFLPLLTGAPGAAEVAALAALLRRWKAEGQLLVPSAPRDAPGFDSARYWRGPVWAVVNWLIAEGLRRHGETELATQVRADTRAAIEGAGFCEYFDPLSRAGLGGDGFSWTAAIYLLLAEEGAAP